MRNLIAFTLCFILVLTVRAQKRSTFSIYAGYNGYTIHGKLAHKKKFTLKPEEGFCIGTNFEFPIAHNIYLQPGIMYNQKGANFDSYHYMGQDFKGDVKLSYIEMPVNIVYKPGIGRGHLIIGAGPYFGLGIGREAGVEQGVYLVRFRNNVPSAEISQNPFYFSCWDAGSNFILGYQFSNNLFLQFNGQVGMKRINPAVDNRYEGNTKHRNAGVGMWIGYRF